MFFEKSIHLLNENGALSLITPNTYLADQSRKLRSLILDNRIVEIYEYTEKDKVFENVTQAVATIVLTKGYVSNNQVKIKSDKQGRHIFNQDDLLRTEKLYLLPLNDVIQKILSFNTKIKDIFEVFQGEINVSTNRDQFSSSELRNSLKLWRGNNVGKYIPSSQPIEWCPINISRRGHYSIERIVLQEVSNQSQKFRTKAFISSPNYLCGHTCNYMILKEKENNLFFYLGLINSKTFNYFYNYFSFTNHITVSGLEVIPIPSIDTDQQLPIITLVNQILEAKQENPQADTSEWENEIDQLVYQLYGLTDEEIAVVEG